MWRCHAALHTLSPHSLRCHTNIWHKLSPNWVVSLPVARLMLVLREKFILGNYICIRLKYPATLFVGTSAGDPGAEMDGDTGDVRMVSTHARLITLSLTNIPAHNVTRSHTQICFKKTTKSVFKLLSQQVLNLNLNACCNTWEFARRREKEGMRRGEIIVDNLRKHEAHSLPLVTRGCRCREGAVNVYFCIRLFSIFLHLSKTTPNWSANAILFSVVTLKVSLHKFPNIADETKPNISGHVSRGSLTRGPRRWRHQITFCVS